MKIYKIIYTSIGLMLLIFFLILTNRGLPKEDLSLINQAYELNTPSIWPDFDFEKYPLAIRTGEKEFLIYGGEIKKRKPALPVIAATAYRINDQINIFMPSKKSMDALGEIAEGLVSKSELMFVKGFSLSKHNVSNDQYVAILYHEAMHAHQIDKFEENLFQNIDVDYEEREILNLIIEIDKIKPLRDIYTKEYEALHKAINEPQIYLESYIMARKMRLEILENYFEQDAIKKILSLENYYEKIEGTARYMEIKVLMALDSQKMYNEYIEDIKNYSNGKEKYYRSGMGICLLLDYIDENWKTEVFKDFQSIFIQLENRINHIGRSD